MKYAFSAAVAVSALLQVAPLSAQQDAQYVASGVRSATASQVEAGPSAESWRENLLWSQAQVISDFVQQEPVEGSPASERTEVRILHDAEAIYIGAWLYDSEADRILAGERRRDASMGQSDAFLVILDTFRDQQNGFVFGTHPGGIEYDGQVVNEGRGGGGPSRQQGGAGGGLNVNWDASWTVATEQDDEGWYAYFRIPFSTLRFGSDPVQTWGVNFSRSIARKSEEVYWSPISRQHNLYRVSSAGTLEGLQVPEQRVFTVTPYAIASARRIPAVQAGVEYPLDIGGDIKVGITQGVTLDLTLNTDFAQVEVDEQQLDLTRFSLFFPEKRPFFLENAGLFAVGSNQAAQLFFSRRIGISSSGSPVPIVGGARLTGRSAGFDVGLLHIRTDEADGIQGTTDYSVARVSRDLGNRTNLGAIFTNREGVGLDGDYGRTYGIDGQLGLGENFTVQGVLGATEKPGVTSSQEVVMASAEYRSANLRIAPFYHQIGANFQPEVGFLRRSNFRAAGGNIMYYLRTPQVSWLRELRPHMNYDVSYTLQGFKETQTIHLDSHVQWESGAMFSPATDYNYEGLERPFRIAPNVTVQPGEYSGWIFAPRFNTSTRVPVVFRTGADVGSFFSGSRKGGFGSVEFRSGSTLAGQLRLEHSQIDLREGSFDATLASARAGYSFSPNLFVQALVQYGSQSKVWSGNIRLGWLDKAGTGLFLVYNERQMIEGIAGPLERSFLVKFTRQFDVAGASRGWR